MINFSHGRGDGDGNVCKLVIVRLYFRSPLFFFIFVLHHAVEGFS